MPAEVIHIRFSDEVDGTRELAKVAAGIAFDFSTAYQDRLGGGAHAVGYRAFGHIWSAWWTHSRAVVVRCEREAAG